MKMSESIKELAAAMAKAGAVYAASVHGVSKYLLTDNGRVISLVGKKPRLLASHPRGKYIGFNGRDDKGIHKGFYVHQLQAEILEGSRPEGHDAAHMNGNRLDNSIGNVRWVTRRENHLHKRLHGTSPDGERNPMAKLDRESVNSMRSIREKTGLSYKAIASKFGVSTMTAYRAITKESWA